MLRPEINSGIGFEELCEICRGDFENVTSLAAYKEGNLWCNTASLVLCECEDDGSEALNIMLGIQMADQLIGTNRLAISMADVLAQGDNDWDGVLSLMYYYNKGQAKQLIDGFNPNGATVYKVHRLRLLADTLLCLLKRQGVSEFESTPFVTEAAARVYNVAYSKSRRYSENADEEECWAILYQIFQYFQDKFRESEGAYTLQQECTNWLFKTFVIQDELFKLIDDRRVFKVMQAVNKDGEVIKMVIPRNEEFEFGFDLWERIGVELIDKNDFRKMFPDTNAYVRLCETYYRCTVAALGWTLLSVYRTSYAKNKYATGILIMSLKSGLPKLPIGLLNDVNPEVRLDVMSGKEANLASYIMGGGAMRYDVGYIALILVVIRAFMSNKRVSDKNLGAIQAYEEHLRKRGLE